MTLGRALDVANGVGLIVEVSPPESTRGVSSLFLCLLSGPKSCDHSKCKIGNLGSTCPPTLGALEITGWLISFQPGGGGVPVCPCGRVPVWACVPMWACVPVCPCGHVCPCGCVPLWACVPVWACACVPVWACVPMWVCARVCPCGRVPVWARVGTHMHSSTHAHTHLHMLN